MSAATPVGAARLAAQRNALHVILPTGVEPDLLRAILWPGPDGREAWERLRERLGGLASGIDRLVPAQKGLLPLLHVASLRPGIALAARDATYLRAAYLREELRGNAYRRILGALLDALASAEVPAAILKGCAFADTVYPDPATRHSHGIELLVHDPDTERLPVVLAASGFRAERGYGTRHQRGTALSWRHERGLPLDLRMTLLGPQLYRIPTPQLWARSVPLMGGHAHARALCPEHNLIHACADAVLSPTRVTLRWACDAWFLLARHGDALDWSMVLDMVKASQLALPLSLAIGFLVRDLRAPVPASVLERLEAEAADAGDLAHEVALLSGLTGAHGRMRAAILAAPGLRARLAVLRPLIAPSPAAMRAIDGPSRAIALRYAARPLGYAWRRLRRQVAHHFAPSVRHGGSS